MKVLPILILNLIPCLVVAQEQWMPKDSIKLSKMLDGEIPIHINESFKKELEQSFAGLPLSNGSNRLNEYILGIKPKSNLMIYSQREIPYLHIRYDLSSENASHKKVEILRFRRFTINSKIYTTNPFIRIERNTNLSIPLTEKLHFNIYGNYTLDKKRSVILPATSIPYVVGAGFSYHISKQFIIKSQTNYQYNIIKKRWEWFLGAGISYRF